MSPTLRRAILLAALMTLARVGAVNAQTICDQLLPIGTVPPEGGFLPGCGHQYALRPIGAGGVANYIPLAYSPCVDGPCTGLTPPGLFVCEMATGHNCCISVEQPIPLVAGNYAGPAKQGIDQRFDRDTDTRSGICYSDYVGNGARLAVMPLIEPVGSGVVETHVTGFLRVFVVSRVGSGINNWVLIERIDELTPARPTSWGRIKTHYR